MLVVGIFKRMVFLLFNRGNFDLIIIEKELVTFMPFFMERMLLRGCKFILDYDDNINARYQVGFVRIFLSDKIIKMGNIACGITVGNHWYMEFYEKVDQSKIYYLPTVINRDLYLKEKPVRQDNSLKIVWIGSLSTVKYLKSIDQVLIDLQSKYNFKLKVIGAKIDLKCNVEFAEWNSRTEIDELMLSDIGIMPLEDTNWEKGKCGFKLIQYMASGLPVVASYSNANSEIINEDCGFIAKNQIDWYNHLSLLLSSPSLREHLGSNGRKRIYEHYSYQTWSPKFINVLKKVGSKYE